MKNSRFTVAIHIMSVISFLEEAFPGELVKSHQIADSVNTSPIVIRRSLAKLRQAGLVEIYGGATGGSKLAKHPDEISLLDVFRAVEEEDLFAMHPNQPSQSCPVGATIAPVLNGVYKEVDRAIGTALKGKTIGDLYQNMKSTFLEAQNTSLEDMKKGWEARIAQQKN